MSFGVCTALDATGFGQPRAILDLGFDYVELGAYRLAESDDLTPYKNLPIRATNLFFPGSIRLYGDDATPYLDHAERVIRRAAQLGVKVMVVGSGGSRRAPEGLPPNAALEKFAATIGELQEIADPLGIKIAPESLNRSETNVGNDLGDLAARCRHYTADLYHIAYEANADGRTIDWSRELPRAPDHVHLAAADRSSPVAGDPLLVAFAARLSELNYRGSISLECNGSHTSETLSGALVALNTHFQFCHAPR